MISHYTLGCKNSHRFHRSAQMLIALFSHRIHRTHRTFCYKNLCKSVKSVGVFSAESSVYSANSVGDFLSRKFCIFREFCGSTPRGCSCLSCTNRADGTPSRLVHFLLCWCT